MNPRLTQGERDAAMLRDLFNAKHSKLEINTGTHRLTLSGPAPVIEMVRQVYGWYAEVLREFHQCIMNKQMLGDFEDRLREIIQAKTPFHNFQLSQVHPMINQPRLQLVFELPGYGSWLLNMPPTTTTAIGLEASPLQRLSLST